jgi:nucleoside-diphosphate-sugar epimerase
METNAIVITGANGFIGKNLCSYFIKLGYNVIGLVRDVENCQNDTFFSSFQDLAFYNYNSTNLIDTLKSKKASVIIHTAWQGVSAKDRENWQIQLQNLDLISKVLEIGKLAGITKFISLGSQAEYGSYEGRIDETYPINPNSAYGTVKQMASILWLNYCRINNLSSFWLRIFSIFGPNEDPNWFISNLIHRLKADESVELTGCEQRYDYTYVEDFAENLNSIIINGNFEDSGIYNLSSNSSISLKEIANLVFEKLEKKGELLFGRMPYRLNQVMHMEGNSNKFATKFGLFHQNFETNIDKLLSYQL